MGFLYAEVHVNGEVRVVSLCQSQSQSRSILHLVRSITSMSQTVREDIERGNNAGVYKLSLWSILSNIAKRFKVDEDRDRDRHQPAPNQPSQPPQGESNFGDSSGPLFLIYSKAAEDEDNKMVERWQKDADGILIFVSASFRLRMVEYV